MTSRPCKDARQGGADRSHEKRSEPVLRCWPDGDHERGASTSGINCLIVLLKRVYCSVGEPLWNKDDESVKQMEAQNPFMGHAWLVLKAVVGDVGAALDQLADRVWGKALEDVAPKDLQFKCLVSHARMQTTLWSMPQFSPMLEHAWWQQDTRRWRQLQHEATPTEVKDYFAKWHPAPTPDPVRLDAFPGMSLDVEVNKLFGEFSAGNFQVLVRPDAPLFFYATFTVKDVGQEKLDFNAFRRFTLETGKFVDVDGVMRWRRTGRPGRRPYNLMALVKYRDDANDHDTIRVYDDTGNNANYNSLHAKIPRYAAPQWRMADMKNGDTFLAMFVYSEMPPKLDPPFPEVFQQANLEDYFAGFQVLSSLTKGDQGTKRSRDARNRQ